MTPAPVTLTLPFPVSLNNAFAQSRRWSRLQGKQVTQRHKSSRYRQWCTESDTTIMAARVPRIKGPVRIAITLHAPDKRRRDADNRIKGVLDSLVRMEVIEADDNRIVRMVESCWGENRKPAKAIVTITPVD